MNFLWQDKKRWPFNTCDCLIEVTACAGMTTWTWYSSSALVLRFKVDSVARNNQALISIYTFINLVL
jgi:hypothetical protein